MLNSGSLSVLVLTMSFPRPDSASRLRSKANPRLTSGLRATTTPSPATPHWTNGVSHRSANLWNNRRQQREVKIFKLYLKPYLLKLCTFQKLSSYASSCDSSTKEIFNPTYISQEVISIKTLLLKLKRTLQEVGKFFVANF